jgi:uncharacterized coiled-coil DUF342 family protein
MSDLDRLADDYNAMRQERDDARDRARRACQILIKEIGAEGPADVEVVAERAACEIQRLRDLQEETEHQMHLRIRAGYDKTIADSWRAKVAEVEAERDEARAEVERLRGVIQEWSYPRLYVQPGVERETLLAQLQENLVNKVRPSIEVAEERGAKWTPEEVCRDARGKR